MLVAAIGAAVCGRPGPRDAPSVLLVTIDTCRADRVGIDVGGAPLTPRIDELGRAGVSFPVAIAPSCFTAPSMASLSTGLDPETHGILQWGIDGRGLGLVSLASRFRGAGYSTAFVSGHGELRGIAPLVEGFDFVRDDLDAPAADVTRVALAWAAAVREGGEPFFLWVHYFDPHGPYRPPERSARRALATASPFGAHSYATWWNEVLPRLDRRELDPVLESLYAGEVAEVDRAIGDLVASLDRATGAARLLVALTADHGENLSDHAPHFAHRDVLYDSLIRVPLVLRGPGVERIAVPSAAPVEILRLPPTLLDLAGVAHDAGSFARPSLLREGGERDGLAYSHSGFQTAPHAALRSASAKVVLDLTTGEREAFDLVADPGETRPLLPGSDSRFAALSDALDTVRRALPSRTARPEAERTLTEESRERLEQLGYLKAPAEDFPRPENK